MSLRLISRIISGTSIAVLGGGTATLSVGEYTGSDHGAVRSYRFWKGMLPIYAHYKYLQWSTKDETDDSVVSEKFRPLHERYSPRVERLALELKGFYYKLAQILSTRDDFLPSEYLAWTKQLQDQSPVRMSAEEVRGIVERSLEMRIDDMFSEWDDKPIGAASVGQVHRAVLAKDGTEVAVKVQFPDAEKKFRADVDTVEMFCRALMPQNTAYFAEIKRQFATEFDMRGEAENLRQVHDNLYAAGWNRLVEVPAPIASTREVLVMTYVPGVKLVDGVRRQFEKVAKRRGTTLAKMEEEERRRIANGDSERVDVRSAARLSRGLGWMMGIRDGVMNCGVFVWNWGGRFVVGGGRWEYWDSSEWINLGLLMDTLIRVHGHEIFADGAFNGDPHPGNFLLMKDGRVGLIDYGQVKRMKVEDRITYAKLIVALSRGDRDEVVRIAVEDGRFETRHMKRDVIYRGMCFFHCRDTEDVLQGMNVSEFMEWMEREDPIVSINDEFVMVGRVSMLLRGLASAFGMKVCISEYWKDEALKFLKSQGVQV